MSNEEPNLYLWTIRTARGSGPKRDLCDTHVTATSFEQVLEYTRLDQADQAVEILMIKKEVPILKELHHQPVAGTSGRPA